MLRTTSNYAPFQVPNPLNNGEQITIYKLDPAQVGKVDTVVTNSDINHRDYQAYEVSIQGRWAGGGTVTGGWAMERVRTVSCDTPNPNQFRFCDQTGGLYQELGKVAHIPFKPEFKLAGTHALPLGFEASASFLSFPGQARSVTWTPVPAVFPGGQRTQPITIGTAQTGSLTAAGGLVPPGTRFGDRWNQLDVGVTKKVRVRTWQMEYSAMLFNSLNSSPVLTYNTAFGSSLDRPLSNLQPRLLRLSVRAAF